MSIEVTKRLFTVHDYHRMGEAGILSEDDRVELIYGEIVAMSPIGPRHNAAVDRANRAMVHATGDKAIVRVQGSVGLDEYNEPQPDIVLLRPKEDFYASRLPDPGDILLIVEIAESSLEYDRTIKSRLYAETGIPEYWVADLKKDCLFAYGDLRDKSYHRIRELHRGDYVAPLLLPECRLRIDVLLP
jgi:Uma2 family endonuclease